MNNSFFNLAVIGNPISHSLSPVLHSSMAKELEIQIQYNKICVEYEELEHWIFSNEAKNLHGFNVTMPHKHNIVKYIDELDSSAREISSVNTVVRKKNLLHGYNTDSLGFIRALEYNDVNPCAKIALLGFGGAGISVAYALANLGADVNVYSRKIPSIIENKNITFKKWEELSNLMDCAILINATPLGMYSYDEFTNLNFLNQLNSNTAVCDLVYNPLETNLLKQASLLKLKTINGLAMLIHQGIVALELFLAQKLDVRKMYDVANLAIYNELKKRL